MHVISRACIRTKTTAIRVDGRLMGLVPLRHGPEWKPFWLATQLYPQNDWTGWQNGVNYDVFALKNINCVEAQIIIKKGAYTFKKKFAVCSQEKKEQHLIKFSSLSAPTSIFVGAEREENLIRKDPHKSSTIGLS